MFKVMKYNPNGSYSMVSTHQDKVEAIRAAKRQARLGNVIFYVMQEHGLAIPSIVVNFEQS